MNRVLNVFVNIFKILLILLLCFIIFYSAFASMQRVVDNKFYLIPRNTNYGENPIWFETEDNSEINGIYNNIGATGTKKAAYDMYITACKNLMLCNSYGLRASSYVSVYSPAIDIKVDVITNRIENYRTINTPIMNANQAMESSYQNTVYIAEVSNSAIGGILQQVVQIAERGYENDGNNYKQSGKLSAMDDGGEVITWNTDYAPEVVSAKRTYEDSEIREKCNFIINLDTMLDNAVITREFDEKQNMYFYSIDIALDCAGSGEEGSATFYEYKAIFDLLGNNMKSLVYSQLKFHMTMYENGYLINWDTVEEWTVCYGFGIIEASGTALSTKYEVFSYDPRDCGVINFTV